MQMTQKAQAVGHEGPHSEAIGAAVLSVYSEKTASLEVSMFVLTYFLTLLVLGHKKLPEVPLTSPSTKVIVCIDERATRISTLKLQTPRVPPLGPELTLCNKGFLQGPTFNILLAL